MRVLGYGEQIEKLQDINMNRYKVIKSVLGNSIQDVISMEKGGTIIAINLEDEDTTQQMGFTNNGQRDILVPKIRSRRKKAISTSKVSKN